LKKKRMPCINCERMLAITRVSHVDNETLPPPPSHLSDDACCPICLGAWTPQFAEDVKKSIARALEPYGSRNLFSRTVNPPTLILPGDLLYRFEMARQERNGMQSSNEAPVVTFCQELKKEAKRVIHKCLDELEQIIDAQLEEPYPECVASEELGYLGVHVIAIPTAYRPACMMPQSRNSNERKRRFHNQEDSQGGDPRVNLEERLSQKSDVRLWSLNQASQPDEVKRLRRVTLSLEDRNKLDSIPCEMHAYEIHAAVWRRPFYLRGMYTKTRRDVSQTPFWVVDVGARRKLGETSVEEQISPAIVRACQGISEQNNHITIAHRSTVFGMAKFHSSGREDMDVRMLLPDGGGDVSTDDDESKRITGRPFVFEIYDALRLPSMMSLAMIVREVNHFTDENYTPDPRSYGRNPMGVGISSELNFVPSSSFKRLQEETESKVKHYGCLCWSERPLPTTDAALMQKFDRFPLEIRQRTPIRVLHRRTNMIRIRHVLSCQAERIDDHYFRLHISTSAGTYVKEFAHGDLGRTVPSVATLLGCNTDILELDCEGIQL
jgi:tRNA pseudouridine(54/55) synthase